VASQLPERVYKPLRLKRRKQTAQPSHVGRAVRTGAAQILAGQVDVRQDDPAVAFAADDGAVLEDGLDDVGLADGRAVDGADGKQRCEVVDHAAGGKIRDDGSRLSAENELRAQGQRIFLADVPAVLIDDGEAGFTTVGAWSPWSNQGYQDDILFSAAGSVAT
jgi:hypothetical protein